MSKKYISNKQFMGEVIISKNIGKRTPDLEKMMFILGKNVIRKMSYKDEEQRKDCLMSGILRLLEKWDMFDEEKYDNAFAFYTEIFKRGIAAEFNRLNNKDNLTGEYRKLMSLNYTDDDNRTFDNL